MQKGAWRMKVLEILLEGMWKMKILWAYVEECRDQEICGFLLRGIKNEIFVYFHHRIYRG